MKGLQCNKEIELSHQKKASNNPPESFLRAPTQNADQLHAPSRDTPISMHRFQTAEKKNFLQNIILPRNPSSLLISNIHVLPTTAPTTTPPTTPPSPPPALRRLHKRLLPARRLRLLLLIRPRHLHLLLIALVLALPHVAPVPGPNDAILRRLLPPAAPHVQADHDDGAPEDEAQGERDPEHDGAVEDVEDLERDEQHDDEQRDRGQVGVFGDVVDEREEVGFGRCEEGDEGLEGGGRGVREEVVGPV